MQASAVFTFANQAGLDMLETTLVALQDILLDKILDDAGRKVLLSEFSKIMQQVSLILHFFFVGWGVVSMRIMGAKRFKMGPHNLKCLY